MVLRHTQVQMLEFDEFPHIHIPEIRIPKIDIPKMPEIKFPPMPEPFNFDEIRKYIPKNQNEHFVGVHSSSFSQSKNINGFKSVTGGAHVIVNKDGKVDEDNIKFNQGDVPKPGGPSSKIYQTKNIKAMKLKPLKMKPIFEPTFKPVFSKIDLDSINTYVPKENEEFVGYSRSSFHKSVNNNGVKHSAGGHDVVSNVNGKVDADKVRFRQGDKIPTAERDSDAEGDSEANVSDE